MRAALSGGLVLALALGCMSGSAPEPSMPAANQALARDTGLALGGEAAGKRKPRPPGKPMESMDDGLMIVRGGGRDRKEAEEAAAAPPAASRPQGRAAPEPPPPPGGGEAPTAVREWFPEAFLWRPLVETDASGRASLDVRVPDQLTTWRVLALAHDRAGHQAGATHTFESTLPAYVDPVVPGWMYVGDQLVLPVQVVNNRATGAAGTLAVDASGAVSGGGGGPVALGPWGSTVQSVALSGGRAGEATVRATLAGVDAVVRTWPVHPVGRPVIATRGGSLSGSRAVSITWPEGADARTAKLSVEVHPGPLAVLTAELGRLGSGGRWTGAYGYGVAGHLRSLGEAAGAPIASSVLRDLRIRSWQRLVREARSPTPGQAADLLLGLRGVEGEALIDPLRARLERTLIDGQRGDGTWARLERDTLQRVLVQTAVAARALPESASGPRLRAQGAIERHQPLVEDPFTAAVLLASGLPTQPDPLLARVREGLVEVDGRKTVAIPAGVASAWSQSPPSRAEMLAWTALALADHDPAIAGDLASELMTGYSAVRGFGAGPADPLALEAVVRALPTVDRPIALSLAVGGRVVASGAVDPAQPGVPAVLLADAPGVAAAEVELRAEPASAGLTFVLTQRSYVPWTDADRLPGVEVEVEQSPLKAGVDGRLLLTVAAPSNARVRLVQALPPGVFVDADALRDQPGVAELEVRQDAVEIVTSPFGAGEILRFSVPVRPTFAGAMVTGPLEVEAGGRSALLAPHRWIVSP